MTYFASSYKNISTASNGTITANRLLVVTVNTAGTGSTLTLYDGSTTSGPTVATIDTDSKGTMSYMVRLTTGQLHWVTAAATAAANITITTD
jgi:hypothetical protein